MASFITHYKLEATVLYILGINPLVCRPFFENTACFIGGVLQSGTSVRRLVREMKNNFTFQDDEKDDDEEIKNYYYTT